MRRCAFPVSKDDLRSLMNLVGPYSIIEAEIDEGSTAAVTTLRRVLIANARDPELEQLAHELQKPIVLHDATLGRLEYDRKYGWYAGRVVWCEQAVEVSLSCTRPDDTTAVLAAATRLFTEQEQWHRRIQAYTVEQLLPLKNDSWLDADEAEMSADEFLSKMRLESISVDESGDFTFWHDDGNLFWGHAIQISGDFTEGLTQADNAG
jgi:hypothetical protein